MAKEMTTIDFIIGLPPKLPTDDFVDGKTNIVLENSMPQCTIYPGIPSFTSGITLFQRIGNFANTLKTDKDKKDLTYLELLEREKFTLNQYTGQKSQNGGIRIAFQADSFPTDSFTNEYGENFLQSMTDVVSEKAASIMQITGNRDLSQAAHKITSNLKGSKNVTLKGLGTGLEALQSTLKGFVEAMPGGKTALTGTGLVSSLAAGSRLDFPMLWKSSGFQPSYTMTIRLYNPYPSSAKATKKYIIGPIAALMLLGIPISKDGKTYSWPFIHRIHSPGIYDLDPAFISNITVIKGGDQQQIAFNQKMGVVDVRIDFGSLYNSILAGRFSKGRPTLTSYLKAMEGEKTGVKNFSSREQLTAAQRLAERERVTADYVSITKNQAPTTNEITDEEKQNPPSRVSATAIEIANDIISQSPLKV